MKNKFYSILLPLIIGVIGVIGALSATAQDSASCNNCHDSTKPLPPPPPTCYVNLSYSHDSSQPDQPYIFFAQPFLAGATADTITWRVNDTIVGWGDTLVRVLHRGTNTVCASLATNLGCQSQSCVSLIVGDTATNPPPPACSINVSYGHDSTRPNQPYYFYASAYLAGATADTITWRVNDTIVGRGDTLVRVLHRGMNTVCASLSTNLGCQSQSCVSLIVGDTATNPPPPDSTGVTPPDSTNTPPPSDSTAQQIRSYPNPAYSSTNLILHLDNPQMIYIRVYNSMGSQVESRTVSGYTGTNTVTIPLSSLQGGIYYIELQYGNVIKRSRIQKL